MLKIKIFIAVLLLPVFIFAAGPEPVFDPPLEFRNIPLKNLLVTLFGEKGNISYVVEAGDLESFGSVTLRLTEKAKLSEVLELILSPRGLKAEKDRTGIYRIRKGPEKGKLAFSAKKISGFVVPPPLDYNNTPLKTVLETVFMSLPEVPYVFDLEEAELDGNVNFSFNKKMTLEEFLSVVLKAKAVTFYRDDSDIFHIIKRSDFEKAAAVKSSTFMGKRTVRDIVRDTEEKELKEKNERELLEEVNKEKYTAGPLELSDAKLSEFLTKTLAGAYVLDVKDVDIYGTVDIRITSRIDLDRLLKMVLEPKGLKAEKDTSGIYHIKEDTRKLLEKKYPLANEDLFYLEPVIEFKDAPLKTALEAIYMKSGRSSFVLDVDWRNLPVKINMFSKQRLDIVSILKILLEPNGLTFYKDILGVVHITKADGSWTHPASPVLPEEKTQVEVQKIYFDPPFEYFETPVKKVLKDIFEKSGLSYALEVGNIDDFGKVNMSLIERTQLETILVMLLDFRRLTFEIDERGMVHIKEAEKPKEPEEKVPEFEGGKNSEMSKRAEKYLEKTMGELGLSELKGLPFRTGVIKIFSSIGRRFTDTQVGDLSAYGEITADIQGGKTTGRILREVLQPKGLTFAINPSGVYNIVKVENRDKYTAKRLYNYGGAAMPLEELKKYLVKILSKEGQLETDDNSKTITITDTPEKIDEVEMYLFYGM